LLDSRKLETTEYSFFNLALGTSGLRNQECAPGIKCEFVGPATRDGLTHEMIKRPGKA